MKKRYIPAMLVLGLLITSNISAHESKIDDSDFMADEIFTVATYKNIKDKETEEAKKKEEQEKQEKEAKRVAERKNNKSNSRRSRVTEPNIPIFKTEESDVVEAYKATENYETNEKVAEGLRLANHKDSNDEMVRKINSKLAGKGLAGKGQTIVDAGIKHNVDPYIITAIAMTESTGGNKNAGAHNAWGRKATSNSYKSWSSWESAIYDEASYLSRVYLDKGLSNVKSIGQVYCPPTAGNWASEVKGFQEEIKNL